MLNIASFLETSARDLPLSEAVVCGPASFTFGALNQSACQVANLLSQEGIGQGDKVALSCPNLPVFHMIYNGILKVGATVVPLNVLFKQDEVAYHLADSDAKAYFCFTGTPELKMAQEGHAGFLKSASCTKFFEVTPTPESETSLESAEHFYRQMASQPAKFDTVQTSPNDTAVILYTSGTTGKPKGAELSHSNIFSNVLVSKDLFNATRNDTHLVVLPLFHSFGQTVQMNLCHFLGAKQILLPKFDPKTVMELMVEHKVTLFAGVPTMYWALLSQADENTESISKIKKTLRLGIAGGASLPLTVLQGFEKSFGVPILEGYGLSETSPVATFNPINQTRKPGSIGLPIWGVEVEVRDPQGHPCAPDTVGEIHIRGHNVMKGYYNKPQETQAVMNNGWFKTGDLAKTDDEGYLFIVDRVKDMIIRGGFNVYPRNVEETLMQHPQVSMAAVIGVPDEQYGEEVKAFIIPKPGQTLLGDDLKKWSKEKMAAYKYPRIIEITDSLPMTATGKILKKELRAAL